MIPLFDYKEFKHFKKHLILDIDMTYSLFKNVNYIVKYCENNNIDYGTNSNQIL
jgi:hypothetical protein